MPALAPLRERYTTHNAAQAILLETPGVTAKALSDATGQVVAAGYRWLSGKGRPPSDLRWLIAKRWPAVLPSLWDMPPHGAVLSPAEERRRARRTKKDERETQGPPVLPNQAGQYPSGTTNSRALTAAECHAQNAVKLRRLDAQIEEAIESLNDLERVTAHAGFRRMRAELLGILECDPKLHARMLSALPEQDPSGAAAQLRTIRSELETLLAEQNRRAEHFLSCGAYAEANRIDAQSGKAKAMLLRARLGNVPTKKLLALRSWEAISNVAALVLREDREALEVCREELEVSAEPFSQAMAEVLRTANRITWPCVRYQKDILGFFRDILGIELKGKQAELALLIQNNDWVACRSGHRVGKSCVLGGAALWFYASFPLARVFITAPTERQLIEVDWREIRIRKKASGICHPCAQLNDAARREGKPLPVAAPCEHSAKIDGYLAEKPKGGLHSEDERQVTGFTARDAESMAGLAGSNILFFGEEASGILDSLFVAIKGNLAGGGRLVLVGNPTRNEGEFYNAFHGKAKRDGKGLYATLTISSWDSPNVTAGRVVVPGLATREWCEARKEEWGEDSAMYKIRVLGVHAIEDDHRLFSVHMVSESEARWQLDDEEGGPLYIGLDPAGPEGLNDESAIAPRRGRKILEVLARRGLDDDGHLSWVLETIARHGEPGEIVTVNVDIEGIGSGTVARIATYAAQNPGILRVCGVRSSSAAMFEPHVYDRMRDELSAVFAKWVRGGGAIPSDLKLSAEMVAHEMRMKITANGERLKVTPKDAIKKTLKRSPDRYDACALSCIDQGVPEAYTADPEPEPAGGRAAGGSLDPHAESTIDPYA